LQGATGQSPSPLTFPYVQYRSREAGTRMPHQSWWSLMQVNGSRAGAVSAYRRTNGVRWETGESVMQMGPALPDVLTCHLRIEIAERSDEVLVESIADGNKCALKALFARHNVQVYRFALRLTGSSSIAEDIVLDVFFDVWRQAAGFEAKLQVSTWLLGIARYKAISAMRRRWEAQLGEDFGSTIEDSADNPENSRDKKRRGSGLQQCLCELWPAQREIIDLVYYHEKSVAEISVIVDAPEKTVKTRMFNARKRISDLLASKDISTPCS
jgi:RNA polymerase sigma-70 factor (ECF subfamily)